MEGGWENGGEELNEKGLKSRMEEKDKETRSAKKVVVKTLTNC